ncbi:MAG: hypothetical protein DME21_04610 [Verrucomicrobia bacterium]|nr:MAG: hypothetical protein DME21_04610 [Verrucomicrobiota bacterium]
MFLWFMESEHLQELDVSWGHERWGETPLSPDLYPLEIMHWDHEIPLTRPPATLSLLQWGRGKG